MIQWFARCHTVAEAQQLHEALVTVIRHYRGNHRVLYEIGHQYRAFAGRHTSPATATQAITTALHLVGVGVQVMDVLRGLIDSPDPPISSEIAPTEDLRPDG